MRVFLTSVLDHRPTWRPAQQRAVSTATDEIRGLIDQLSVAFHRLAVERRLLPASTRFRRMARFR